MTSNQEQNYHAMNSLRLNMEERRRMKDEIKRLNDTVEWQRITLLPQSEVKKAITKAKAKMKKEGDETADRLARTALSVMDDYKEAAEEIKQLKEEIREREEERYCMWKTYCVFQDPDIWDDEEDYSKNLNSS